MRPKGNRDIRYDRLSFIPQASIILSIDHPFLSLLCLLLRSSIERESRRRETSFCFPLLFLIFAILVHWIYRSVRAKRIEKPLGKSTRARFRIFRPALRNNYAKWDLGRQNNTMPKKTKKNISTADLDKNCLSACELGRNASTAQLPILLPCETLWCTEFACLSLS